VLPPGERDLPASITPHAACGPDPRNYPDRSSDLKKIKIISAAHRIET
jgi:hypothetical protein